MNIKEVIYKLVGQDLLSPALAKIGVAGEKATRIMDDLQSKTKSMHTQFNAAAREIPGMTRALSLAKNPLTAVAAGAMAVGAGLKVATDRAAAFNREFRNLANLNLTRSRYELDRLRSQVLNTAYAGGFDLTQTNTAYYDVQSIAGLYGAQAAPMVRQGMEFARLMGADPNTWVAGMAKAQANYGFGNDKIDAYQRAAYATLVAGATTFDEIAKVAPVFAGSAAAAGQSFEDAFKVFTLFTSRTKTSDEAATMTNSLFRSLTKANTLKGFAAAGINPYDSGGNFRSVIDLMLALSDRFASQKTQQEVDALRNQFQGDEGLTALLNAAAESTQSFKNQLKNFTDAELNLDEARRNAAEDTLLLRDELKNRLNVELTKLGTTFLPMAVKGLKMFNGFLDKVNQLVGGNTYYTNRGTENLPADIVAASERVGSMSPEERAQWLQRTRNVLEAEKEAYKNYERPSAWKYLRYGLAGSHLGVGGLYYGLWKANAPAREHYENLGRINGLTSMLDVFGGGDEAPAGRMGAGGMTTDSATSSAVMNAIGGGKQARVINVSIGSLVGSQSFNSTVKESVEDITAIVEEALVRAVYGAEQLATAQ